MVKGKESGPMPNSFYNRIMFNPSNFWGALHFWRGWTEKSVNDYLPNGLASCPAGRCQNKCLYCFLAYARKREQRELYIWWL